MFKIEFKTGWRVIMIMGLGIMGLATPLPVGAEVAINSVFLPASVFPTFGSLMSVILSNAVIGAGLIFLFLIIGGGIAVIHGAGGGDKQKVGQGQKAITAALLGFMVVFAAYWIVQILGSITGLNLLNGLDLGL